MQLRLARLEAACEWVAHGKLCVTGVVLCVWRVAWQVLQTRISWAADGCAWLLRATYHWPSQQVLRIATTDVQPAAHGLRHTKHRVCVCVGGPRPAGHQLHHAPAPAWLALRRTGAGVTVCRL